MADTKLSALTALAAGSEAAGDLLYIDDVSAGTSGSKSVRMDQVLAGAARLATNANLPLGAATVGTSGAGVISQTSGTAPTTAPTDCVQHYSADFEAGAGDARLHILGEAGNPVAIGNNAVAVPKPAAAAGASVAGRALTVRAGDAVASTDTAGAAAGGDLNVTAGAAARLTSGNADGGNVIVTPGALIGSGTNGKLIIRKPGGVAGTDEGWLYYLSGTYIRSGGTGGDGGQPIGFITQASSVSALMYYNNTRLRGPVLVGIPNAGSAPETPAGFDRDASNVAVVKMVSSAGAAAWLQNSAGRSRVTTADVTNVTTTLANCTGLTFTSIAGRKYTAGRIRLYLENATAADGIKLDLDGGTGTWTSFRATYVVHDTSAAAPIASGSVTAIATDFTVATVTGAAWVDITFSGVANAAGTFIPRFAKNSDAAGATLTLRIDSFLAVEDCP